MNTKLTGGPAFPNAAFGSTRNEQQGMTLRDYFAAKAMQAMLAHPESRDDAAPSLFARAAYTMADAMLEARNAA